MRRVSKTEVEVKGQKGETAAMKDKKWRHPTVLDKNSYLICDIILQAINFKRFTSFNF